MKARAGIALLALAALGCGKYGPPVRAARSAPPETGSRAAPRVEQPQQPKPAAPAPPAPSAQDEEPKP